MKRLITLASLAILTGSNMPCWAQQQPWRARDAAQASLNELRNVPGYFN